MFPFFGLKFLGHPRPPGEAQGAVDPPGPGPSGDRPGEVSSQGEVEAMEHLQIMDE